VEIPEKFDCLFNPKRYKVFYGGRGGAKSWAFARALLTIGVSRPIRVLCARELQKSIKDSVHQVLSDQIKTLGLEAHYEILQTEIRGTNGTRFSFAGLKHNATEIKSHEGADICWVEEAEAVSATSWKVLIPTIRKPGSEIWVSFNPSLETDETYQRFVVTPPKESMVEKVNWRDNPWFPDVLKMEMEELRERKYDEYLHVWEGHCRQNLEGAVYADEMRAALEEERITHVPVDNTISVDTFWDLGWADFTSIWFVQKVGFEYRVIDFHQDNMKSINHYVQVLQNKGYAYGKDFLPHDAKAHQVATGKSVEEVMRSLGRKTVVLPRASIEDGIRAVRDIFSQCVFDEGKCSDGLQALRHYRYDVDPDTGMFNSKKPLHDQYSHAADGFRQFAMGTKPIKTTKRKQSNFQNDGGWMGM
jgi:phage terminase large subunit